MFTKVINEDLLLLVDVATLKRHCRIDHDLDDNLLEMYLLAAHYAAGEFTRRRPFNTEAAGMFERYSPKVFMPGGNVRQVLSIQALSPNRGMVNVDFSFNPIAEQVSIPAKYSNHTDFTISFQCGYRQNDAPRDYTTAILMMAATMYEVREDMSYGVEGYELPFSSKSLLRRHVLPNSTQGAA